MVSGAHDERLFPLQAIIEAWLSAPVIHEHVPHPSLEIVDVLLLQLLDRYPSHSLIPDLVIVIADHQ